MKAVLVSFHGIAKVLVPDDKYEECMNNDDFLKEVKKDSIEIIDLEVEKQHEPEWE